MNHDSQTVPDDGRTQPQIGQLPPSLVTDEHRQQEVAYIIGLGWQRLRLKEKQKTKAQEGANG